MHRPFKAISERPCTFDETRQNTITGVGKNDIKQPFRETPTLTKRKY